MKSKSIRGILAGAVAVSTAIANDDWVSFSENGDAIVAKADSIETFTGGSSVIYELEGENHRIGTKGFKQLGPVTRTRGISPFGETEVSTMSYAAPDTPFELTLTL